MSGLFCLFTADRVIAVGTIALVLITYFLGKKQIKVSIEALEKQLKASNEGLEKQLQASREALGVDLVLRFDDRFNSLEMKKDRQLVVNSKEAGGQNFQPILDFFETVGYLTRKGTLDQELVWSTFSHWVYHYRHLANDYMEAERRNDETIWEDFLWLYERLLEIEMKRRPGMNPQPTRTALDDFIEEEMNLLQRPAE